MKTFLLAAAGSFVGTVIATTVVSTSAIIAAAAIQRVAAEMDINKETVKTESDTDE
jgi:hypothetical protein